MSVSFDGPMRRSIGFGPGFLENVTVTVWRRSGILWCRTVGDVVVDCGHDQHRLDLSIKSWLLEVAESVGGAHDPITADVIADVHVDWALDEFHCHCGRDICWPTVTTSVEQYREGI